MSEFHLQSQVDEFVGKCLKLIHQAIPFHFNPYTPWLITWLNPSEIRWLEMFVGLCIEHKMMPDLRLGWSYPLSSEELCSHLKVPREMAPAVHTLFRVCLQQRLGADEFLGGE